MSAVSKGPSTVSVGYMSGQHLGRRVTITSKTGGATVTGTLREVHHRIRMFGEGQECSITVDTEDGTMYFRRLTPGHTIAMHDE